jgi:DNA-binding transcriptional MerR regulator
MRVASSVYSAAMETTPDRPIRTYQIGEVARRAHLSLRTLRYWEEVGLIAPTNRTEGGFRLYTDADLDRVMLIRHMKPVDFSIEELRELAELRDTLRSGVDDDTERAELAARMEGFITRIRSRCEVLQGRIHAAESAALELETLVETP